MRPYYEHAGVTIYHGSIRLVAPELPVFDVVITDPPYGVSGGSGGDSRKHQKAKYLSSGWTDDANYIKTVCVKALKPLLARATRSAITPGIRCLHLYPVPADMGCFWTPAAMTHGPWGFTTFQPILYYGKDFRAGKGPLPSGRLLTEASEKNGHPCPKPEMAWEWLLNKVSQPEEVVLDPFCGSGTTLVVAKNGGRKAIGVEIEERYCEIAAKRLAQEVLF